MDISSVQKQMAHQADAIASLASGLTAEEINWKPDPESWSVMEVIDHLLHEEINDFRSFLDHVFYKPDTPWLGYPPMEKPIQIRDPEQHFHESLAKFLSEREKSQKWIAGLTDVDWDTGVTAPWGAKMTAGSILASWLAHDLLHVRQLVELRYALTAAAHQPYSVEYAGEW